MPFIPHTENDVTEMLAAIGVGNIDALFEEIPPRLRCGPLTRVPAALSEQEVSRLMQSRAAEDGGATCFVGAGAYDHHIPAAVWEIATRGEFYSAYTPYQAEASQGTLQLIYEFQSMMTALTVTRFIAADRCMSIRATRARSWATRHSTWPTRFSRTLEIPRPFWSSIASARY